MSKSLQKVSYSAEHTIRRRDGASTPVVIQTAQRRARVAEWNVMKDKVGGGGAKLDRGLCILGGKNNGRVVNRSKLGHNRIPLTAEYRTGIWRAGNRVPARRKLLSR